MNEVNNKVGETKKNKKASLTQEERKNATQKLAQDLKPSLKWLDKTIEMEASDIHFATNRRPRIRKGGNFKFVEGSDPMTHEDLKFIATWAGGENACSTRTYPKGQRWRIQMEKASTSVGEDGLHAAFRFIRDKPPPFEQLGPSIKSAKKIYTYNSGLVFVAGGTGSGKSTTLASLIALINKNKEKHIITIEDPIEYLFKDQKSLVTQRELGTHYKDHVDALKTTMRADPDIVMIGECRTGEDFRAAMDLAATGHLVLSTIHARDIGTVCERIGAATGDEGRSILSQVLIAVISQQLVPLKEDRSKRVLAAEVIYIDHTLKGKIKPNGDISSIAQHIYEDPSRYKTMDRILAQLVKDNRIEEEDGRSGALLIENFEEALKSTSNIFE